MISVRSGLVLTALLLCPLAHAQGIAAVATIDGAIGPATTAYVEHVLERAKKEDAAVVVLRLDTPGGLGNAMRDIVKRILASPVPVIGFVAPAGARAASAGTYILYATHLAAMAPATNVGAATPVSLGGDNDRAAGKKSSDSAPDSSAVAERRKVVNDSVAYIRSLAERRGRNAHWAEMAVRQGVSLTAQQALAKNVIELIADDVPSLLKAADGRSVSLADRTVTLHTAGLKTQFIAPGWRIQLLSAVTDPTIAYLLLLAGIFGLAIELLMPGAILPGVSGGICLLIALFAFQALPVNFAGLALIVLGIGLFVGEGMVPSFGVLGIGGLVAFVTGSLMLMDSDVPGYGISLGLIIGIAISAGLALVLMITYFLRSRRRPVSTGTSAMIGAPAKAKEDFEREGWVIAHGETWRARTLSPLHVGQRARITAIDGLTLTVEPVDDSVERDENSENSKTGDLGGH